MSTSLLLLLLLLGLSVAASPSPHHQPQLLRPAVAERARRSLVYPGGIVQLLIGFGTPISIPRNAMTLGVVMKYKYDLPGNGSVYLTPYALLARQNSRSVLYSFLSDFLTRLGIDGRTCLLRAICEAAEKPFTRIGGLAEDLLHILLTPSTTAKDAGEFQERDYHAAERHGQSAAGCHRYRRACDFDLLALVSSLHHHHDHEPGPDLEHDLDFDLGALRSTVEPVTAHSHYYTGADGVYGYTVGDNSL